VVYIDGVTLSGNSLQGKKSNSTGSESTAQAQNIFAAAGIHD
jgi:hypothetical protein